MKRSLLIVMTVAVFTLTGCDLFRTLAGRPTSEEIESKRLEIIMAQKAVEQARLDSLKMEQKVVQDSIAALDSIKQQGGTILNPSKLGGLFATKLEARYYIIVGSFRQRTPSQSLSMCRR